MFCENVQDDQKGTRGCPVLSGTRVRSSSGIRWTGIDAPALLIRRIQRPLTSGTPHDRRPQGLLSFQPRTASHPNPNLIRYFRNRSASFTTLRCVRD